MNHKRNFMDYSFLPVESVESVENKLENSNLRDKINISNTQIFSTDAISITVESVEQIDLLSYFSTLSTELKIISVEKESFINHSNTKELGYFPHIPHIPQEKEGSRLKYIDDPRLKYVFEWFQIVVSQGHIEPSQSSIGKLVGWPSRKFAMYSLYMDFKTWWLKSKLGEENIPSITMFCFFADILFHRDGDEYSFPSLEQCRKKFLEIKRDYESSGLSK